MKKHLCLSLIALSALAFSGLPNPAAAADVVFPGYPPATDPYGVPGSLFPGTSLSGNTVTITGGNVPGDVAGGITNGSGSVFGNTVTMSAGSVGGRLTGGRSFSGSVRDNSVLISGGSVFDSVFGGYAVGGDVSVNSVIFGGNAQAFEVYGGRTETGSAAGNQVRFLGGASSGHVVGGLSTEGSASGNRVELSGGEVGGFVIGGQGVGTVSGNSVVISGGSAIVAIGGTLPYISLSLNAPTAITGNSVLITGGTIVDEAIGGERLSPGDTLISGNSVTISGGLVGASVYGGRYISGPASVLVSDNSITISGGSVKGDIIGGYNRSGDAVRNTVTISGAPDLAGSTLYGGFSNVGGHDVFSGNTLNILQFRGSVRGLHNFENYNFFLPALGNRETQISVTGSAPVNMNNTTVSLLGMEGGPPYPQPGNSFILIDRATGNPAAINAQQVPKGAFLLYDFDVSTADGTLRATLRDRQLNPDSGILPHGPAAALAFMGHYADLVTGLAASRLQEPEERRAGPSAYAVTTGGSYRCTSDSSTRISGASFLTGFDWRPRMRGIEPILGVFFEAGHGNYDSRHEAGRFGAVEGNGDISYYGGGLLGFAGLPYGFYAEASLRGGRARSEFTSKSMRDVSGRHAEYSLERIYYGAHAGLGLLLRPNERTTLDIYGKYLWLRQEKGDVTLLREKIRFAAADSQRLRAGVRFSRELPLGFIPYVGVAYDQEVDGAVRARVEAFSISSSSLRGGTAIGELGCAHKSPGGLLAELGVKGFEGIRSGVSGHFRIGIEF